MKCDKLDKGILCIQFDTSFGGAQFWCVGVFYLLAWESGFCHIMLSVFKDRVWTSALSFYISAI